MSARRNILQRLRLSARPDCDSAKVRTIPARKIAGLPAEEFAIQAEISGAQVRRLNSAAELDKAREEYLSDGATVVDAALAIAETGSVALRSIDTKSADSYLCDHLVVCVAENRIALYLHEGLAELKARPTRALHLVTGPSRTADVEQTIQIGAHGPRQLTLLIYSDESV